MDQNYIYTNYIDVWRGFLGNKTIFEFNNTEIITTSIMSMLDGELVFQTKIDDLNLEIFSYAKSNPFVGIISTWEKDEQDNDAYELFASLPIFKGIDTKLTVKTIDFDKDLYSGHITAESKICQTSSLTFYVPEFFKHMDLKPNTERYVELAGLGLIIDKAPQPIQCNKGWFYEKVLSKFSTENSKKEQKDLKSIEIRQLLVQDKKRKDGYTFTADILSAEKINLTLRDFSINMYKLKIAPVLNIDTGETIDMYLYVHENTLNGYTPKIGDNIIGNMILFGNIL